MADERLQLIRFIATAADDDPLLRRLLGLFASGQAPPVRSRPRHVPRGWLTVSDVTAQLRFPSEDACRHWLRRAGIVSVRRGRVILIDERDLDHALRHGSPK